MTYHHLNYTTCPLFFQPSDSIRASHAPSLRYTLTSDPSRAESLLEANLSLAEVVVLGGLLKMSPVEARMKMEGGGVLRQGLRLGKHMTTKPRPQASPRLALGDPRGEAKCFCTGPVL